MSDEWAFWQDQLRGLEPETTPGKPHNGYYLSRNRQTFPNPNPGVGEPRRKVKTTYEPCAIWQDESGWHCIITGDDGPRYITEVEKIDQIFSYVCRNAIGYDEYRDLVSNLTKESVNV